MYARSKLVTKFVSLFDQLNTGSAIADILITSVRNEEYNSKAFNKKLNTFSKTTLQQLSSAGIRILTRSDKNRLHSHVAMAMTEPAPNFDWTSFEESERYYKLYQLGKYKDHLHLYKYYHRKYTSSLPASWRAILRKLTSASKQLKLGRVRMVPVRKNTSAYKWYLVGNIPRTRDARDKGLHYLSSWNLSSPQNFQVVNKHTTKYRQNLAKFAMGLQLTSENYNIILRNVLGAHWYCRCEELIKYIDKLNPQQQYLYNSLKNSLDLYKLRSS